MAKILSWTKAKPGEMFGHGTRGVLMPFKPSSPANPGDASAKPAAPSEADLTDPAKLREWLTQNEPKRESFPNEESYLEALDGFKYRLSRLPIMRLLSKERRA